VGYQRKYQITNVNDPWAEQVGAPLRFMDRDSDLPFLVERPNDYRAIYRIVAGADECEFGADAAWHDGAYRSVAFKHFIDQNLANGEFGADFTLARGSTKSSEITVTKIAFQKEEDKALFELTFLRAP
jgi:hypothetical protein